jgi:hypothetical protein
MAVEGTEPDCILQTTASYWNPQNRTWEEIREDPGKSVLNLANQHISWKPTQVDFLDDLVGTFGNNNFPGSSLVTPDYVNITIIFYTFDAAYPLANISDVFTIQVHGNGKTKTELCDFSVLSIKEGTAMEGTRFYYVGENENDGWE